MSDREELKLQGQRLRAIREEIGLSRNHMASRLGIKAITLKNAENGMQKLGDRTFREAERALEAHKRATAKGLRERMASASQYESLPPHSGRCAEEYIAEALRIAEDDEVIKLAKSLSDFTGCTYHEAVASVVSKRLKGGGV